MTILNICEILTIRL